MNIRIAGKHLKHYIVNHNVDLGEFAKKINKTYSPSHVRAMMESKFFHSVTLVKLMEILGAYNEQELLEILESKPKTEPKTEPAVKQEPVQKPAKPDPVSVIMKMGFVYVGQKGKGIEVFAHPDITPIEIVVDTTQYINVVLRDVMRQYREGVISTLTGDNSPIQAIDDYRQSKQRVIQDILRNLAELLD